MRVQLLAHREPHSDKVKVRMTADQIGSFSVDRTLTPLGDTLVTDDVVHGCIDELTETFRRTLYAKLREQT